VVVLRSRFSEEAPAGNPPQTFNKNRERKTTTTARTIGAVSGNGPVQREMPLGD
jgi:hypothetical protein